MKDDERDEDLVALFSQLDSVKAPSSAQKRTLSAMVDATSETTGGVSVPTKHRPSRTKLIFRFAAVACLVMVCAFGGIAYATPTAYVSIACVNASGETTTIELGVDRFGIVVSATASDEDGQQILSSCNPTFKDFPNSLKSLLDTAEKQGLVSDQSSVDVTVSTDDAGQSQSLAESGRGAVSGAGLSGESHESSMGSRGQTADTSDAVASNQSAEQQQGGQGQAATTSDATPSPAEGGGSSTQQAQPLTSETQSQPSTGQSSPSQTPVEGNQSEAQPQDDAARSDEIDSSPAR